MMPPFVVSTEWDIKSIKVILIWYPFCIQTKFLKRSVWIALQVQFDSIDKSAQNEVFDFAQLLNSFCYRRAFPAYNARLIKCFLMLHSSHALVHFFWLMLNYLCSWEAILGSKRQWRKRMCQNQSVRGTRSSLEMESIMLDISQGGYWVNFIKEEEGLLANWWTLRKFACSKIFRPFRASFVCVCMCVFHMLIRNASTSV